MGIRKVNRPHIQEFYGSDDHTNTGHALEWCVDIVNPDLEPRVLSEVDLTQIAKIADSRESSRSAIVKELDFCQRLGFRASPNPATAE